MYLLYHLENIELGRVVNFNDKIKLLAIGLNH